MWNLPGPGMEPMSPALAHGFLITGPPRKSNKYFFKMAVEWMEMHIPRTLWMLRGRWYCLSVIFCILKPLNLKHIAITVLLFVCSFSHQVVSDSLRLCGLKQSRPPCSSPSPGVCPSSCPVYRRAFGRCWSCATWAMTSCDITILYLP